MKSIFYILIFTVGFSTANFAQLKPAPGSDAIQKFIRFYPNPAISVVDFEFQKGFDKFYSFQIYNFIGKKVYDVKTVTPKLNISLTDFYRGVYIYQLRDRSGRIIESGKFQVIK